MASSEPPTWFYVAGTVVAGVGILGALSLVVYAVVRIVNFFTS